jgi:hypothetical protein
MIYVGIDPGLNGAITELNDEGLIVNIFDMPLVPDGSEVSEKGLWKIIKRYKPGEFVAALEASFAMQFRDKDGKLRQQSVSSMLTYGLRIGSINGLLIATGIRYYKPTPKVWQSKFGVKGKQGVSNTVQVAEKLFPETPVPFSEPNNRCRNGVKLWDGRSDSAMIALWCHLMERRK